MEEKCINVSVIVPVYNAGQYLRPFLDSIVGQTLKELQIIIIDDASTDGSWKVLNEYAEKDSRIILLRNPYNLGAARTRNIGIQIAQGEYLSVLDSDDYFDADYLETMYNACITDDLDVAITGVWIVDEKNGIKSKTYIDKVLLEKITKVHNYMDIKHYVFTLFSLMPFNKMVKRNFINDHCLQFQSLEFCNDVFWSEICLVLAKKMRYLDFHKIYYRYNTLDQISAKRGKSQYPVYMATKKIYDFLNLIGIFEHVKESYFTFVSNIIFSHLRLSNNLKDGIEFWKSIGLKDIGLFNVTSSDFVSDFYYNRIMAIKSGRINSIECDAEYKISVYEKFFKRLNPKTMHIGIWGFGNNGIAFYQEAIRQKIYIVEIYDKDEKKWITSKKILVKSYKDRNPMVDTIVVTNSRYLEEIVKEVKSKDDSVKVVDFDLFLRHGIFRMI